MDVTIRPAAADELSRLQELMYRATEALPNARDALQLDSDGLSISREHIFDGRILVADRGGETAGFVAWRPIGDTTAEMHGIFIEPDLWQSGVETILMDAVCDAAARSGLRNLYAIVVPEALELYRHYGFVRTGVTATSIGPVQTMIKALSGR